MHPVPWTPALRNTARRLNAKQMDWWLTGSMALAVRGVPIEPRDIDLVVAEPDVTRAAEAFADVLIEPSVEAKDWISRWFGRAWLGARVEWVAGVAEEVDQPASMYGALGEAGPPADGSRLRSSRRLRRGAAAAFVAQ